MTDAQLLRRCWPHFSRPPIEAPPAQCRQKIPHLMQGANSRNPTGKNLPAGHVRERKFTKDKIAHRVDTKTVSRGHTGKGHGNVLVGE